MQTISIKLTDEIATRIDEGMSKHNYATRSEFIREAIREHLRKLEGHGFETELRSYLKNTPKNGGVAPLGGSSQNALSESKSDAFAELERKFEELREHLR